MKRLWKTRWGLLLLQSEHPLHERRVFYGMWHATARPHDAPRLPDESRRESTMSRRLQEWVDANGGEVPSSDSANTELTTVPGTVVE